MNSKPFFCLLSLTLGTLVTLGWSWPTMAWQRGGPDKVRDVFVETRAKAPSSRGRSRSTAAKKGVIGLGYTLVQRDPQGNAVRVSPAREFHQGDAVRLVIESNVDGYLYVFHTENDRPAKMLFPDARLNAGANRIRAHVPYEAPSSREPEPKLRWFTFNENPATERLYLVVTKTPLPATPTGKDLVAYCRARANGCPWQPAETAWGKLVAAAATPVREDKGGAFDQMLTAVETKALERGLGLGLDAPAPSVIRLSNSPRAKQLVTMLALIHK